MNGERFIQAIKLYVRDAAVEDVMNRLMNPPGRIPGQKHVLQSEWFQQLSDHDKGMVRGIITESVDEAVFGLLAVLDGVRLIDEGGGTGELVLRYSKNSGDVLINDPNGEYLHDIYNGLTNP